MNKRWSFGALKAVELAFFVFASASLAYSVFTAPAAGVDVILFRQGAENWASGVFHFQAGPSHLYPPFALPLFWPLTLVPPELLRPVWLGVNLAAAALVCLLILKLFGTGWTREQGWLLGATLVSWAPFRVTLRNGQISLLVTAALLGALIARKKKAVVLSGVLLGLSLAKYTLTFPFFLYFVWKREWKIVAVAIAFVAILVELFALQMDMSPVEAITGWLAAIWEAYASPAPEGFTGTTEFKLLILSLTGSGFLTSIINVAVTLAGLGAMWAAFSRTLNEESLHYSAMALFSLWFAYHRTYDSVLCIIPAAALIGFLVARRHVVFSRFWLCSLALFAVSLPGLLTERMHLSRESLESSIPGWIGLHIERLIVFTLFWSFIGLMLRSPARARNEKTGGNAERRG